MPPPAYNKILPNPVFLGAVDLMTAEVVIGAEETDLGADIIIGNVAGTLGIISAGVFTTSLAVNEVAFFNNRKYAGLFSNSLIIFVNFNFVFVK